MTSHQICANIETYHVQMSSLCSHTPMHSLCALIGIQTFDMSGVVCLDVINFTKCTFLLLGRAGALETEKYRIYANIDFECSISELIEFWLSAAGVPASRRWYVRISKFQSPVYRDFCDCAPYISQLFPILFGFSPNSATGFQNRNSCIRSEGSSVFFDIVKLRLF